MRKGFPREAVVLGLLTAIGPFAIDMYLPSLPLIGRTLAADTGAVQLSLMVFFVALGLCQLVYGPLSDMYGRKAPLYVGLAVFAAGSVGCALAPDIHSLILFRFVQGVGACAGMVIPRAVIRDLHTGAEAARLMSLVMLVFSVSPILAPLAGSAVIELAGWRAVFWVVMVLALAGMALNALVLKETRPRVLRVASGVGSALAGYRKLLADRTYLGLVLIGAFGISSFFAYLANSSFVLIDHYGLSPGLYSIAFSINAVAFIGMSQLNGWLARRHGLRRVIRTAVVGYAVAMVTLLCLTAAGVDSLAVMAGLLFVGYGFLGLVIPTSSVLAMEEHGAIAGTASALMGTIHFVTGAATIAVLGLFIDGTALPMIAGIAACAVLSFTLAQLTLRRRPRRAAEPAPAE